MTETTPLAFDAGQLHAELESLAADQLDALDFGVIGFGADEIVVRYNATESRLAGLSRERVVGLGLFAVVAPCFNNFLVAQRFQDAAANGTVLDDTIDYVLTLRMRPQKVRLRLLASPALATRYVLIRRRLP